MTFGDRQPREKAAAPYRRDRLARQDHRALRHRNGQHTARGGRQHLTLGGLLFDHRALGAGRGDLAARDIDAGAQLVKPLHRCHTPFHQRLATFQFGLGGRELRIQCFDLGVQGGDLEGYLVVMHPRDGLPGLHQVAFGHRKFGDGSADARTRWNGFLRFHTSVDGLPFRHRLGGQRDGFREGGSDEEGRDEQERTQGSGPFGIRKHSRA